MQPLCNFCLSRKVFPVLFTVAFFFLSSTLSAQSCDPNNYAAGKTVVTNDNPDIAGNIVDGNLSTDWFSALDGGKWIYVDLGQSQSLCKVTLKWGYWSSIPQTLVQGSNDASSWTDLYTIAASDHGLHATDNSYDYIDVDLSGITTAYRYVRLYYASGASWGPHLKELEVYVKQSTLSPTVSITAPTNGASFSQGSTITLSADASEPGGSISKVEFYVNGSLQGQVLTAPYNYTWSNVQAGDYTILAHAHDASGQMAVSGSVTIHVTAPSSGWSLSGNSGTVSGSFLGTTDNNPLILKTNGIERFRIDADGKVAINASADASIPTDAALAVDGQVYAKKLHITQSSWADYVFHKDYKLPPLKELENYINTYHHLPGVPTTKKVQKEGVDVADNQEMLLRKIEELTLYVIDLNKKVEKLSKENTRLKQGSSRKK